MKKLLTGLLLLSFVSSWGQILKPIEWQISLSSETLNSGDEVDLVFKATIDPKWYLYSSDFDPELGPMVTEFTFEPGDTYDLIGNIEPVHPKKKYDSIFEGEYTYFKGTAEFRQRIRITTSGIIKGNYTYQVCSDIDGKCIPFDDDFSIPVNLVSDDTNKNPEQQTARQPFGQPSGGAGILHPARWEFKTSTEDYKTGDEIDLIFSASIDPNWYLYSSDFDPELGPLVTTFNFTENPSYEIVGKIKPVNPLSKYDSIFEGEYTYFKKHGEFRQTIKVLKSDLSVTGSIDYQVCSDVDGKCIPFEEDFSFGKKQEAKETLSSPGNSRISLTKRDSNSPYSLLAFMGLAFLGGLAALLTPCVFPMIPVTVTYFTKSVGKAGGKSKALLYGLSIILLYTIVGVGVSLVFGAEVMNDVATSATANLIFFAVFVLFGLSFLGLFEINLPSSFLTRIDKQADRSGYLGIFFMALTLCVVSFSCTGPIVGSILVESAGGAFLKPTLGMFAFSMAFAIPFTFFAFFPRIVSKLPKSGGWLNSVKVLLGFIELALSLKFLSIADQVYHWRILDREVFLAIWIVILFMMGLYLLRRIKLPGDDDVKTISVPRLIMAIATFTFVAYLIPGMFGAPLKALAGYLPPLTSQDFNLVGLIRDSKYQTSTEAVNELCDQPKYADLFEFPLGLKGYFDYKQAIVCARKQNKPLFIDFTGFGCVNCREMEARVWSDPEVWKRLNNDFVLVSLYVDDKTDLPESEWYTSPYDGKVKKTIGKQNADFQITRFQNNAQPFYVILDDQENLLMQPKAYDLKVQHFIEFLDQAKAHFQENSVVKK